MTINLCVFLIFTVVILARYLLLSAAYDKWIRKRLAQLIPRRIISRAYPKKQQVKEIFWSTVSSVLFGFVGMLVFVAHQEGCTVIYLDWNAYPLWYLPLSFLGVLAVHETYYYWLHRAMHLPFLYKRIHKTHHDSTSTSVWTSFSFHPLEALLQALIFPIIVVVIPLHLAVIVFLLVLMTLSAIINHAGVEIYPSSWRRHALLKWMIGSTHHDLHHRRFTKNYGLYFTCWDTWMGTESEELEQKWSSIEEAT